MLPFHAEWAHVLSNLRFVVIDEAHTYKGIFGAHVALILRRLRRLAVVYGSRPSFMCCSATVSNPGQLFTQLTGLPQHLVITDNGSPCGRQRLLVWNPLLQQADYGLRCSCRHVPMERSDATLGPIVARALPASPLSRRLLMA